MGSLGKGIREFKKSMQEPEKKIDPKEDGK